MKYASLKFNTTNLGDEIQNIAAEQFLPTIHKKFDRDQLNFVNEKEKYLTILNGWFTHIPLNWPPSDSIVPIFIGFHITDSNDTRKFFLNKKSIDYFKSHEPIGCRDHKTSEMLIEKGVNAYYSKCLTLTFQQRKFIPKYGKVFFVDMPSYSVPEAFMEKSHWITHIVPNIHDVKTKALMAKRLLNIYFSEASLVITTRLHCALPCIAFGIPVIFFGDRNDYRISLIEDLGIKINTFRRTHNSSYITPPEEVDWNPKSIDIKEEKAEITKNITEMVKLFY